MPVTRSSVQCKVVGAPLPLPKTQLPTGQDVLRYYNYIRLCFDYDGFALAQPNKSAIASRVADKVIAKWGDASLTTVSKRTVIGNLLRLYDHSDDKDKNLSSSSKRKATNRNSDYMEIKSLVNHINNKNKPETYEEKLSEFQERTSHLFDISSCSCDCSQDCSKCSLLDSRDKDFLVDQRGERMMHIGCTVDKNGSVQLQKKMHIYTRRLERKMKEQASLQQRLLQQEEEKRNKFQDATLMIEGDDNEDMELGSDSDFDAPKTKRPSRNGLDFSAYGCALIDQAISTNSSVIIGNALLECLSPFFVPRTNIAKFNYGFLYRLKKNLREEANADHIAALQTEQISSLYLDSKIDSSWVMKTTSRGTYSRVEERQDHYTLIAEPGSKFITTISIEDMSESSDDNTEEQQQQQQVSWSRKFCFLCL